VALTGTRSPSELGPDLSSGADVDLPVGDLGPIGSPTTPTTSGRGSGTIGDLVPVSATDPFSASGLYAVLVAGALSVLFGGLLFKRLGVKVGWR
jgi:hypothetical protein